MLSVYEIRWLAASSSASGVGLYSTGGRNEFRKMQRDIIAARYYFITIDSYVLLIYECLRIDASLTENLWIMIVAVIRNQKERDRR